MNAMSDKLHQFLAGIRSAIGGWLPLLSKSAARSDPLADKLKDLNPGAPEDEETVRRQVAGQVAAQDALAKTVYNARPQNPFSKDF